MTTAPNLAPEEYVMILTNTANQMQIIDIIRTNIASKAQVKCSPYTLVVTGFSPTPLQVLRGHITDRSDLNYPRGS